MRILKTTTVSIGFAAVTLAAVTGCRRERALGDNHASASDSGGASTVGPAASAIPVDMSKGWCGEHGVPESVCTRCGAARLIPEFQAKGDWCGEHGLPESQCTLCHPEAAALWAALREGGQSQAAEGNGSAHSTSPPPEQWGTQKDATRDTESASPDMSRGTPELASQDAISLVPSPRIVSGGNDPLCTVNTLRVRFRDGTIAERAGIETAPAVTRNISATVEAAAEVEFNANLVTRITPRAAGVVRSAAAQPGDRVEAGQVLAVIESAALGEAKSEYIQRREDDALARADLERAELIHEGVARLLEACTTDATTQQVQEQLAAAPVGEAKSRLLQAHAALLLARANAEREAQLLQKEIGSRQEYEAAQSALAAAEADFIAAREEIAFDSQRQLQGAQRAAQVAASAVRAAERRLHLLGLTDEEVAAIGTEPDEALSRYELRSPVPGVVIERRAAIGEAVAETDPLFVMADPTTMWLMMDAYQRDLPLLREGQPVLLTLDGLPGRSFEGRITWIASQVDDRTRTVRVRADLPNPDGLLRAKMFGRARIIVHEDAAVVAVPRAAVQTDGCCQLVFVQQSDTEFEPRKVALGADAAGYVEVLSGLREGEVIATAGSFLLKTEILKGNIGAGCCEVDPGR